jgi:hypothetical protein
MERPDAIGRGGDQSVGLSRPEQRIGRRAILLDAGVARANTLDLGFEQGDSRGQLVLRIGVEAFLRQLGGGIASRAAKVIHVHAG